MIDKNLLLVEPDKLLANSYLKALSSLGYRVLIAHDAQGAINQLDKTKVDLVILEVQLVEHSGIEFLYELRSYPEWDNVKVIILSSIPNHEFKDNLNILKNDLQVEQYLYKNDTKLNRLVEVIENTV